MNNREYLIHILLRLRGIGIKNEKILQAVEKVPPHFYYSLYNFNEVTKRINIEEVLEIAKLLQLSINLNYKYENVLLFGFKYGWLLVLLANFCKRVYGICNSELHKKKLEFFFFNNNFKNIYLCKGENIISWRKVAPFDLVFILNRDSFSINSVAKQLSDKGMAFMPNIKNKNINMISINKEKFILNQSCNFDLLSRSDLI